MDPEQMIDVPISAEDGNVAAPSEPQQPQLPDAAQPQDGNVVPTDATPVAPQPAPTAEPNGELFDLPDGRKVDAVTLAKEWKDNFLPDYTRKSQALAAQKQQPAPISNDNTPKAADVYADPNYIPSTYAEIIEVAKTQALEAFQAQQQQEIQRVADIENHVNQEITDIKSIDPSLNENALFQHAVKYGFNSLKAAHANMKDMYAMAKTVQQQTAKNIQQRANEPIATTPGKTTGTQPNPNDFQNAREYLRSLQ